LKRSSLNQDCFPTQWKNARLLLIRKGEKLLENPSSYRPLCMINTTRKLLEKILDNRLREFLEETGGLTHSQYGFRKGKSTIDALNKLNDIVKNKGRKNYAGMLTIDIKNALNSTPWGRILESLSK
jgi:hypothetical protein